MRIFALGFVAGACLLQQAAELPEAPWGAMAALPLLACFLVPRERALTRAALLLGAGLLAGYGWSGWRAELRLADALPRAMEGVDVAVTGLVADLPQRSPQATRFLFEVERAPPGV